MADFDAPARWIDATQARYLHASRLRSPMGRELVAFSAAADTAMLVATHGGRVIGWPEVQALAVQAPVARPTSAPDHDH